MGQWPIKICEEIDQNNVCGTNTAIRPGHCYHYRCWCPLTLITITENYELILKITWNSLLLMVLLKHRRFHSNKNCKGPGGVECLQIGSCVTFNKPNLSRTKCWTNWKKSNHILHLLSEKTLESLLLIQLNIIAGCSVVANAVLNSEFFFKLRYRPRYITCNEQ